VRAIIADTGPLYAEVDQSDQYHARSRSEIARINQEKLAVIVPYPIFLEAHRLVLYTGGHQAAIAFAERLLAETNLVNPLSEDYQAAARLIARFTDQKITLFDAVIAVLATTMGLPVWTYDYHFDVMGIQVWR
jgi:predicted nucleic acid-binding protein